MANLRLFLCTLSCMFFSVQLFAQHLLGKITDKQSGMAIPFVSIGIVGSNNASISNENGEFVLKNIQYPAKIRFSHVSYQLFELNSEKPNGELNIQLSPASISLAEVRVDPFLGSRLVKAAIEKTLAYKDKMLYANAFYRQLCTINDKPSQIYELFYDFELNAEGIKGWKAKQSRFAELNEGIRFSISNQSYLTFSLARSVFENQKKGTHPSLATLKNYDCSVERYIEQADQNIVVVSCKYKGNRKNYYTNATYYIGQNDKQIYRIESSIFNLPMNFSGSVVKIPPVVTNVSTFNLYNNTYPIIESVSTKMFLNLTTNHQQIRPVVSSLLSIYQLSERPNEKLKMEQVSKNVQDKSVVEALPYDPVFWKNNEIVKQTTLAETFVKMMENKAAFGTMIEKP